MLGLFRIGAPMRRPVYYSPAAVTYGKGYPLAVTLHRPLIYAGRI